MTAKKTTPELPRNNWQLMSEWHPDYKSVCERMGVLERAIHRTIEGSREDHDARSAEREFLGQSFAEALEAFARHVWDQACREQREICAEEADIDCIDWDRYQVDKESILSAPAPEFKLTEKE